MKTAQNASFSAARHGFVTLITKEMLISAGTASSRGTKDSETIITMVHELPDVLPYDENDGKVTEDPSGTVENLWKSIEKLGQNMKKHEISWKKRWKIDGNPWDIVAERLQLHTGLGEFTRGR